MEKIDFVIPWVDGNDPAWQSEFIKFKNQQGDTDASMIRYRDWDNMQYWFRGVEKFAPWVGKIHFITWGHLPEWLNTKHPKLNIVNHKDYIPAEYLPTFSIFPIELNMHRIKGLSEQFLFLNDDMFLIREVEPTRFFKKGKPRDIARLAIDPNEGVKMINKRYNKNQAICKHPFKWFNYRYTAADMFKTMTLLPWQDFYGFKITHMPQPFLRSTFETLWTEQFNQLDETSRHTIRYSKDLTQYAFRYEQLATGNFIPVGNYDNISVYATSDRIDEICTYISQQKGNMICINDNEEITDFEGTRDRLNAAFNAILPDKCSYEL